MTVKRRVPWERKAVEEKREILKKASLLKRNRPTKANMQKFNETRKDLGTIYQKE